MSNIVTFSAAQANYMSETFLKNKMYEQLQLIFEQIEQAAFQGRYSVEVTVEKIIMDKIIDILAQNNYFIHMLSETKLYIEWAPRNNYTA